MTRFERLGIGQINLVLRAQILGRYFIFLQTSSNEDKRQFRSPIEVINNFKCRKLLTLTPIFLKFITLPISSFATYMIWLTLIYTIYVLNPFRYKGHGTCLRYYLGSIHPTFYNDLKHTNAGHILLSKFKATSFRKNLYDTFLYLF